MIISVVYLLVRCLLGCLMVLARGEVSKDAELLVLRHEAETQVNTLNRISEPHRTAARFLVQGGGARPPVV